MRVGCLFHIVYFCCFYTWCQTSVRVASFNIENYLVCDRWIEGKFVKNYPKPENAKDALRKLIKKINPDVLALQEIGTEPFLKELQNDLKSEGLQFPFATIVEAKDSTRHIAVLSKLPFKGTPLHHQLSFSYQKNLEYVKRGLLEVSFENETNTWRLFVVHLKSKRNDMAGDRDSHLFRELEAKTIARFIQERFSLTKELFILAGDFNDSKSSQTLKHFIQLPVQNLPHKDSRLESWTYRYGKEDSYIRHDFILPSKTFQGFLSKTEVSIDDSPESLIASDHRPIYIDLVFKNDSDFDVREVNQTNISNILLEIQQSKAKVKP